MEQPIKLNTRGTPTWLMPRDKGIVITQGSSRVKLDAGEIQRLYAALSTLTNPTPSFS
jgi:hypothetical protein